MVTLRREARTDEDRYGGYKTRFSGSMSNYDTYTLEQNYADNYNARYDAPHNTPYFNNDAMFPERERENKLNRWKERVMADTRKKSNISSKALLIIYAVIVAVFVALIIANSTSAPAAAVPEETLTGISQTSNNAVMDTTAADIEAPLNAVDVTGTYELLPESAPVTYEVPTNWFDKFCNFLSNLAGG